MSPAPSLRRAPNLVAAALIAAAIPLSGACKPPPPEPRPLESPECRIAGDVEEAAIGDTIVVALGNSVRRDHAPVPRNDAERLVFAQLYRTLVTVDCTGRLRPDLAVVWAEEAGGRRWRFDLDPAARSRDGSQVTALDIVSALAARLPAPRAWAGGGDEGSTAAGSESRTREPQAALPPGIIDSLQAVGELTLVAHLARPLDNPKLFADPSLAVSGFGGGPGGWPGGLGRFGVSQPPPWGRPGSLVLSREADAGSGAIVFWPPSGADPRDLLEAGADLLITDDLEVVEYARARPELTTEALPWERAYVMAATTRVRELRAGAELKPPRLDDGLLASLARDAVRATARAHAGSSWWSSDQLERCTVGGEGDPTRPPPVPSGAYGMSRPRRLVYDTSDPIARDLAERLVALTASGASQPRVSLAGIVPDLTDDDRLVAFGRDHDAFEGSLSRGEDFAYLLSLPLRVYDACLELARVRRRAEWLSAWDLDPADVVIPLIDVRPHAIIRRGVGSVDLAWDGTPILMPESH